MAGGLVGVLLLALVWQRRERGPKIFVVLFTAGWLALSALTVSRVGRTHAAAVDALRRGEVTVVEGPVTDFVEASPDGSLKETFKVGGTLFVLDDLRDSAAGLTLNSRAGGPIRKGMRVRLTVRGGRILKVEETSD